jgi:hypothetical protein
MDSSTYDPSIAWQLARQSQSKSSQTNRWEKVWIRQRTVVYAMHRVAFERIYVDKSTYTNTRCLASNWTLSVLPFDFFCFAHDKNNVRSFVGQQIIWQFNLECSIDTDFVRFVLVHRYDWSTSHARHVKHWPMYNRLCRIDSSQWIK